MINRNWVRWMSSSLAGWFKDHALDDASNPIPFYVDGDDRSLLETLDQYYEFRMNGPVISQPSKDVYRLEAIINILCVSKRSDKTINRQNILTGIMSEACTPAISALKYGTNPQDDQSFLGCMQLCGKRGIADPDSVDIIHLGQINPDVLQWQSMVEAYYCLWLGLD